MPDVSSAILITGAASGTGAALARLLARPGLGMALHSGGSTSESAGRLEGVRAACAAKGALCIVTSGDLTEPGHGGPMVEATLSAFGRLDQMVHAAGHVDKTPFGALTRAGLDRSLSLMPGALLEMATAAAPALAASGAGRVVAVSSFLAHRIERPVLSPASVVAKAALEALVRCLAVQLAPGGTTVNAVIPGYTRKDAGKPGALSAGAWEAAAQRTPTGRLGEAGEVAAAIRFLLSAEAGQITGALLPVDGGLMLG